MTLKTFLIKLDTACLKLQTIYFFGILGKNAAFPVRFFKSVFKSRSKIPGLKILAMSVILLGFCEIERTP